MHRIREGGSIRCRHRFLLGLHRDFCNNSKLRLLTRALRCTICTIAKILVFDWAHPRFIKIFRARPKIDPLRFRA
jgi:hypothetical protein